MNPEEINAAINRAVEGIRAGHKLEMSVLQNEIARLKEQISRLWVQSHVHETDEERMSP